MVAIEVFPVRSNFVVYRTNKFIGQPRKHPLLVAAKLDAKRPLQDVSSDRKLSERDNLSSSRKWKNFERHRDDRSH
ncbi:hypothetical protein PHSY_004287 [Pseudozyma hubeiensis SY62]|uniref:Uncharacterized protein n=1 Tax=Pseudozyma hubeiensis (strain SY62) TaxID=1305764 RepID=R9P5K4_PSEHS|nr:hypothetical protein PHSY_004287 [Pseudozyma hubeiensis SY62]GAC96703.1 hypothetical protein PHSY_004287 [Pseudozyma hubeiensis SY62]